MMTVQVSGGSSIYAATKRNGNIFLAYIVVLLVTGLVIAAFTWLTWDSGNKLQDAIRVDADARIQEAVATSAEANKIAKKLENDNLTLRAELSKQQELTAQVEVALEKERAKRTPRRITASQAGVLVSELKGKVEKLFLVGRGEQEPLQLFDQFREALVAADLLDSYVLTTSPGAGNNWIGIILYTPDAKPGQVENDPLVKAFRRAGIPINSVNTGTVSGVVTDPKLNRKQRTIYIGEKPLPD